MKIIEDSQIHLNTLRKLYQVEKRNEQKSHLDDLLESSGDEDTGNKIIRDGPVVISTDESDTEPKEDAASTTGKPNAGTTTTGKSIATNTYQHQENERENILEKANLDKIRR